MNFIGILFIFAALETAPAAPAKAAAAAAAEYAAYEAELIKRVTARNPDYSALRTRLEKIQNAMREIVETRAKTDSELAALVKERDENTGSQPDSKMKQYQAEQKMLPLLAADPEYVKLYIEEAALTSEGIAMGIRLQHGLFFGSDPEAREFQRRKLELARVNPNSSPMFPVGIPDEERPKFKSQRAAGLYCLLEFTAMLTDPEYAELSKPGAGSFADFFQHQTELIRANPDAFFAYRLSWAEKKSEADQVWKKILDDDPVAKLRQQKRVELWRKQQPILQRFIQNSQLPEAIEYRNLQQSGESNTP